MKKSNKFVTILTYAICIIFYISLVMAINFHNKFVYGLIFFSSCVQLFFLWNEKTDFLKIWNIVMVIHSTFILLGLDEKVLEENWNGNILVLLFVGIAEILAVYYGKVMILFFIVFLFLAKVIFKSLEVAVSNKIYGPFPNVQGIVKRDKKVYFHKDSDTKTLQLIYRHGHNKKILDTYNVENFYSGYSHYSLEWEAKDYVIVKHYDDRKHRIITEKKIDLPRN